MKFGVYDYYGHRGYPDRLAAMEAAGFDTIVTDEWKHDPFSRSAIATTFTKRPEVMTSIAVAFGRTPMSMAYGAHDMQVMSGNRFILGLGSQVKAHIVRRYSMPWSHPAPRMKEYIQALHAIWDCWYEGKSLQYEGEFYRHTLMTPNFTPHELDNVSRPKVHLGAVGPYMTKVAGEVADGLITHSFTTPSYMRAVTLPRLEEGLKASGRQRKDLEITGVPFIATGETEEDLAASILYWRRKVAFYCSTTAYRPVLDHHGWGELNDLLLPMSREGKWEAMGDLIDDEVFDAFVVSGPPAEIVDKLMARFGDLYDRLAFYVDFKDPKAPSGLAEAVGRAKATTAA